MSEKSHVSIEQQLCPVCLKAVDTNAILFHKRLMPVLERTTVTGIGQACNDCRKRAEEGYVALVEIANPPAHGTTVQQTAAARTGRIFHMRRKAYDGMFDVPPSATYPPMCFIDPEVGNLIISELQDARAREAAQRSE